MTSGVEPQYPGDEGRQGDEGVPARTGQEASMLLKARDLRVEVATYKLASKRTEGLEGGGGLPRSRRVHWTNNRVGDGVLTQE